MIPQLLTQHIPAGQGYITPHYRVNSEIAHARLPAQRLANSVGLDWPEFCVWPCSVSLRRPVESVWELCLEQARLLYAKHGSIRLWYSGGSDSHAVLEAFLQSDTPLTEIAIYRRFPGAVDEYVNVEIDVFPVHECLRETLEKYQSRIPIRVYDIMPDAINWYLQDPEHRWFRNKSIWPFSMNSSIVHECYPELQSDGMINLTGSAPITLSDQGFHWVDADFNRNFMTPRVVHFFADNRLPELAFAYAYAVRDLIQQRVPASQHKLCMGLPRVNNFLWKKWIYPQVDGKPIKKNDWRFCKKELLLINNCDLSKQGQDTWKRLLDYYQHLQNTVPGWFNGSDVNLDFIGNKSEFHYFRN